MPELPEVETVVRDLNRKIKGETVISVWSDTPQQIRDYASPSVRLTAKDVAQAQKNLARFKRDIVGEKILGARRSGKNVLIDLSHQKTLLVHQKMTGHLLVGKWQVTGSKVQPLEPEAVVKDSYNKFIHLILGLKSGQMLALSDVRKFAKAILAKTAIIEELPDIKGLGPDALSPKLTYTLFKKRILVSGPTIKQVLLRPEVISGIGNIYSDDILYTAKVHPRQNPRKLTEGELRQLYAGMRRVLARAVKLRGTSTSDFRDTVGLPGGYTDYRLVYQREGEPCQRCRALIKRITVGGRSAHFCPVCQKSRRLYAKKNQTQQQKKS